MLKVLLKFESFFLKKKYEKGSILYNFGEIITQQNLRRKKERKKKDKI